MYRKFILGIILKEKHGEQQEKQQLEASVCEHVPR